MTTKAEIDFYLSIKDELNIVIDAGCQMDNHWLSINDKLIVHAFDPVTEMESSERFIFNKIGLGAENTTVHFNTRFSRITSGANEGNCNSDIKISLMRLEDYINDNNIGNIDYLKIDTESWDYEVIKGTGRYINEIKYIQVEKGWAAYGYDNTFGDIISYLGDSFDYISIGGKPENIVFINKNA